jgi:4-hydroxy-3-methylbut-2-en-1-yl diphosphate reductase
LKIIVAKDAGYCFGVRDAVNTAFDTINQHGEVYMLGDIVHNEKVVADLAHAGAKVVEEVDEIPSDSPVLFRAHGTVGSTWDKAKLAGLKIIDATCPLVHEIHSEVKKLSIDGRQIIIVGDHGHDEVIGIASQVDNAIVVANPTEAKELKKMKRAGIVCQSTQIIDNVQEIINVLMIKVFDLHFVNTICFPTKRNQEQIRQLAKECDVMLIIGSFTSANSKRLTQLSLEINPRSYQVTTLDDVDIKWFSDAHTVGISAGASTPDYIIEDVKNKLSTLKDTK